MNDEEIARVFDEEIAHIFDEDGNYKPSTDLLGRHLVHEYLRQDEPSLLCDGVLKSSDKKEFRVNMGLLAMNSQLLKEKYFFNQGGHSELPHSRPLEVPITYAVLHDVLHFLYSYRSNTLVKSFVEMKKVRVPDVDEGDRASFLENIVKKDIIDIAEAADHLKVEKLSIVVAQFIRAALKFLPWSFPTILELGNIHENGALHRCKFDEIRSSIALNPSLYFSVPSDCLCDEEKSFPVDPENKDRTNETTDTKYECTVTKLSENSFRALFDHPLPTDTTQAQTMLVGLYAWAVQSSMPSESRESRFECAKELAEKLGTTSFSQNFLLHVASESGLYPDDILGSMDMNQMRQMIGAFDEAEKKKGHALAKEQEWVNYYERVRESVDEVCRARALIHKHVEVIGEKSHKFARTFSTGAAGKRKVKSKFQKKNNPETLQATSVTDFWNGILTELDAVVEHCEKIEACAKKVPVTSEDPRS